MRITFDEVNLYGEKTVKCAVCGKRIKRRRKFWQTINPYNRRADGLPKTETDILAELRQERAEWLQAPETCQKCQQNGGEPCRHQHAGVAPLDNSTWQACCPECGQRWTWKTGKNGGEGR